MKNKNLPTQVMVLKDNKFSNKSRYLIKYAKIVARIYRTINEDRYLY